MAYYRIFLLNEADRIVGCREIECDSDDAVLLAAARLGVRSTSVEIWAGARKVIHLSSEQLAEQRWTRWRLPLVG